MTGNRLKRRTFIQISGAAAIGSAFMFSPKILLANDTDKKKKTGFKLSKPRWIIYENGSYDLISDEIILKNCRPAIDGQGVMPKNVFLGDSPKGKRIVYELPEGFLMLDLKTNNNSISIGAELSGFTRAPRWFFPISQAEVFGVHQFFKQGFGTGGQSGVYDIIKSGNNIWENRSGETSWSYDSYLTFAFLGKQETIAIGNTDHTNFLQRSTIYNRPHRKGLDDQKSGNDQIFFESAMLLEEIKIKNEYIKLPELCFYTGNKPYETLQELSWRTGEETVARQSSITSYHIIGKPPKGEKYSFGELKSQIDYLNTLEPALPLHSVIIDKGYCEIGDWLEPNDNWPGGLDRAAREIFKEGYRAGIWLAPFAVSDKSKLFRQHPEWIIKNYDDELIPEQTTEEGTVYSLDGSHPDVQKYLRKVFSSLRKMGFIFYETALMDLGLKDSWDIKRDKPGKTSVQYYREILEIIREEIGMGSMWMMDNVPYAPSISFADIVRISHKLNKSWDTGGVENMIQESYYSHYFNNIYWQNSADEIKLTNEDNNFSAEELESLALWQAILGGAVGVKENIINLSNRQLKMFRFLEPSKRQQNAYFPFWPDSEEIKVAVRLYKQQNAWAVLFFNDKNEPISKKYPIIDIIDKESAFVYLWSPEVNLSFGELAEITIELRPHHSRLFFISEKDEAPPEDFTLGGRL